MRNLRLKFAIRSLLKNKTYTILNVVGLAIGLAVSIIIFMYLQSELTYDKHIANYKEIYRVHSEFLINDERENFATSGMTMGPMLQDEFDYIEGYTRLFHIDYNVLFKYREKRIYENQVAVADSQFFRVFQIPFLQGDPDTALLHPRQMVVTKSFANRYFEDGEDALGKIISTNNFDYTVTGVIPDFPANSHHRFEAVISAFHEELTEEEMLNNLWNANTYTFLRLNKHSEGKRVEDDFAGFYQKYMQQAGENFGGAVNIYLERLDKIHFGPTLQYDQPLGNRTYLYAFAGIGLLILMLACINYINMATARGMRRVKEAGLRKIMGSSAGGIRQMIFAESFALSLFSLFIAFALVELVLELTPFNQIMVKDLALDFERFPILWWLPLLLALLVGFFSGLYPALTLARVPAVAAIQRGFRINFRSNLLRKSLVGFQFCVSVAVVITALLMYRQMDYIRQKDLGFNKEDIVMVPVQDTVILNQIPRIREELDRSPYILASSMAWSVPGGTMARTLMNIELEDGEYKKDVVDNMHVGLGYFETMEIAIHRGRDFLPQDTAEANMGVIVNESFVDEMDWEEPIGKIIRWGFDEEGRQLFEARVVGVSSDFNSHSLHDPIIPTIIFPQSADKGTLHVRIDSEHLMAALNDLEAVFAEMGGESPFRFSFLNKELMQLYQDEHRQSRLILYLTILAIFISFLGLTGLASFTTSQRTREIGVRKVLGADIRQMVQLIFRDMLRLVLVSVVLAIPLAYFLIRGWLSGFAYSARLDPMIFAVSALVAVAAAYLIVTYHSVKVARSSPVDTLKWE